MKNAMQLKAIVKNIAKEKRISAQLVLQNYMLERFLERVALSQYRSNFILKGGFLIASMVGLNSRATMDMDATIKGYLVNKETGKPVLAGGEKITAKTEFTAEEKNGSVELTFTIDSSILEGATVVVFEDLRIGELNVASHADINDEEQSVHYPKVRTKARVGGKQQVTAGGTVKLIDTVSYRTEPLR